MQQNQNFDSQLQTYFNQIKNKIKKQHVTYLRTHPELRQILNDFLSSVLLEQPQNVYEYAQKYFTFFNHKKDQVRHNPLVISGCSGVGKGTIIKNMINNHPELFQLSISFTTRNPRQGQVNGREYYFVTVQTFKEQIKKNSFIEYCQVHGNYYGTHKGKLSDIISRGKIAILEIDVQGGKKIFLNKDEIPCNFVFIDVPSIEELEKRLRGRGTEKEEDILKRIKNGFQEIEQSRALEYYHKIVNRELDDTFLNIFKHFTGLYPDAFPQSA